MIASGMYAFHKSGLFKVVQKEVPSDVINMVFDNFHNVFGSGHKVTVEMNSDNTVPDLKITSNNTTVNMDSIISIKNPMNHMLDAIVIRAVTSFEMKPTVTEHSTGILLTASLQSITLKVTSYKCLFLQEGEKSLFEIETSLSTFIDVLRRTLNDEYLAKGIKLPLPAVFNLE